MRLRNGLGRLLAVMAVGLAAGGTTGQCRSEDHMNDRVEVHFQELVFGSPEDKFFVATFDSRSGTLDWEREYKVPASTVRLRPDDEPASGVVQKLAGTPYAVATQRVPNGTPKYRSFLLDSSKPAVVRELGTSNGGGAQGSRFLFASAGELKSVDLDTGNTSTLEKGVDAVAVTQARLVKFTNSGKILDRDNSGLGTFEGIVTNAGPIVGDWIWYFARKNEKSAGNLWTLNVKTGAMAKVDRKLPQCRLVLAVSR